MKTTLNLNDRILQRAKGWAAQRLSLAVRGRDDLVQFLFRGHQQRFALQKEERGCLELTD